MKSSPFIRAMHPKTEISPDQFAIRQVLANGWVGQMKVHGHRAQIHVPAEPKKGLIAYTRQGKIHTKKISEKMSAEIFRLFRPLKGWNAIDAEWLKELDKLYVFDFLKAEGETLWLKAYPERWALLPKAFLSPHVKVLPILRDLPACMEVIEKNDPYNEGLVFKSSTSTGFSDTSIIRCRRKK